MRVERRDLVNLGQREPHFLRQCRKVRRREMAVLVLDQEIATSGTLAQKRAHVFGGLRVDLATLRGAPGPATAGIGAVAEGFWQGDCRHGGVSPYAMKRWRIVYNPLILISRLKFSI